MSFNTFLTDLGDQIASWVAFSDSGGGGGGGPGAPQELGIGGRQEFFEGQFDIEDTFGSAIADLLNLQGSGANPLQDADINALFDPSISSLDALRGSLDPLEGDLRRGALASTQGASLAAVQGARAAAGGRGGLAFGGGAGAIGARAAQQASVGQSTALANSLVQARTARAGFESDLAGRRAEVGSAKVGALGAQQASRQRQLDQLASLLGQRASGVTQGILGKGGFDSARDISRSANRTAVGIGLLNTTQNTLNNQDF